MSDRLNQVLAISDIKLSQGLDRIGADLKGSDRLERVAEFKNKLGLALVDYVVATKQTRLVGGK